MLFVGRMRRGINTIAATRSRYPPYATSGERRLRFWWQPFS